MPRACKKRITLITCAPDHQTVYAYAFVNVPLSVPLVLDLIATACTCAGIATSNE